MASPDGSRGLQFILGLIKGLAGVVDGTPYHLEVHDLRGISDTVKTEVSGLLGTLSEGRGEEKAKEGALRTILEKVKAALTRLTETHSELLYGVRAGVLVLLSTFYRVMSLTSALAKALAGIPLGIIKLASFAVNEVKRLKEEPLMMHLKDLGSALKAGEWQKFGFLIGQQLNHFDPCDFNKFYDRFETYEHLMKDHSRKPDQRKYISSWIKALLLGGKACWVDEHILNPIKTAILEELRKFVSCETGHKIAPEKLLIVLKVYDENPSDKAKIKAAATS